MAFNPGVQSALERLFPTAAAEQVAAVPPPNQLDTRPTGIPGRIRILPVGGQMQGTPSVVGTLPPESNNGAAVSSLVKPVRNPLIPTGNIGENYFRSQGFLNGEVAAPQQGPKPLPMQPVIQQAEGMFAKTPLKAVEGLTMPFTFLGELGATAATGFMRNTTSNDVFKSVAEYEKQKSSLPELPMGWLRNMLVGPGEAGAADKWTWNLGDVSETLAQFAIPGGGAARKGFEEAVANAIAKQAAGKALLPAEQNLLTWAAKEVAANTALKNALKDLATSEVGSVGKRVPKKPVTPAVENIVEKYKTGEIKAKNLVKLQNGDVVQAGDIGFIQPGAKPFEPTVGLKYDENNMHPIYRVTPKEVPVEKTAAKGEIPQAIAELPKTREDLAKQATDEELQRQLAYDKAEFKRLPNSILIKQNIDIVEAEIKSRKLPPPQQGQEIAKQAELPKPQAEVPSMGIEPPKPLVPPEAVANQPSPMQSFIKYLTSSAAERDAEAYKIAKGAEFKARTEQANKILKENLDKGVDPRIAEEASRPVLRGEYPVTETEVSKILKTSFYDDLEKKMIVKGNELGGTWPQLGRTALKSFKDKGIIPINKKAPFSRYNIFLKLLEDEPEVQQLMKVITGETPIDDITRDIAKRGKLDLTKAPSEGMGAPQDITIPEFPKQEAKPYQIGFGPEELKFKEQVPTTNRAPPQPSTLSPDLRTAAEKEIDLQSFKEELNPPQGPRVTITEGKHPGELRFNEQAQTSQLGEKGWTPTRIQDMKTLAQREKELTDLKIELAPEPKGAIAPALPARETAKQPRLLDLSTDEKFKEAMRKAGQNTLDALNLTRTIIVNFDVSMPFRQAIVAMARHPVTGFKNFRPMFKALFNKNVAENLDLAVRQRIYSAFGTEHGLQITSFKPAAKLTAKEESFLSRWTQHIPGVKQSERAAVTFLNYMRSDIWESAVPAMQKIGATSKDFDEMAKLINISTGRGSLGKFSGAAPLLNVVLFSPRLMMSRVQLPTMLFSSSTIVRKEAAKSIASFLGVGATALGAYAMLGGKLELDPRSSDFGKMVIGKTRVDIWGGHVQYARFIAQLMTGQKKTDLKGVEDINREQALTNFLQSKTSPLTSLMLDILAGKDYSGQPMSLEKEALLRQVYQRMTPLMVQDTVQAIQEEGVLTGSPLGIASGFGVGIVTYGGMNGLEQTWGGDLKPYYALPSNAERAALLKENPNAQIPTHEQARTKNPDMDAKLFITGQVKTLQTRTAVGIARRLLDENSSKLNTKEKTTLQQLLTDADKKLSTAVSRRVRRGTRASKGSVRVL